MSELVHVTQKTLPVATEPPLVCAADKNVLHLLAVDETGRRSVHLALDAAGDAAVLGVLPLLPASIAATGKGLFVTGSDLDGEAVWARLRLDGRIVDQGRVPHTGELVLWPRLLEGDRQGRLVWATDPVDTRIWLAPLEDPEKASVALECAGPTFELSTAALPQGLAIARITGSPPRVELSSDFQPGSTVRLELDIDEPLSPRLIPDGNGVVLLVVSRKGSVELRRFSKNLEEVESATVDTVAPARPRASQLISGGRELGVSYQVATRLRDGSERVEERVCLVGEALRAGPRQRIEPAGAYDAAGWAGDTLLVVHGREAPIVSTFTVS